MKKMIKWTLQTIPIKDLKEHPKNPRKISRDQLQKLEELIDKFGMIDKPIVNADMTIIGGHQRIKILKKNKEKECECWVSDRILTDEEIDHLCIGLNLNQGEFDYEVLGKDWDVLDLLKWGFTENQVELMQKQEEKSIEEGKSLKDEHIDKRQRSKKVECPKCGHEFETTK